MSMIYEVRVDDGTRFYFDNEPEADFYAKDTVESGFGVTQQQYEMPTTPSAFCRFMERIEADIRPLRQAVANCDRLHN